MAFEGIKEQLKDNWADLSSKIQENSAFNNVREKFESQPPTVQRAIVAGVVGVAALFLASFPWGYISSSQDSMQQFEENRSLITGLLHASRTAKETPPLPPPIDVNSLKTQVDGILKENRIIPDQIGQIQPLPDRPAKDLAPAVVIQTGIVVQLKRLNLDQIMTLSHRFQSMGPGMKLMGIDIVQSAGQNHYYDFIARIVNFALPAMTLIEEAPDTGKAGGKKAPKPKHKTVDEGIE